MDSINLINKSTMLMNYFYKESKIGMKRRVCVATFLYANVYYFKSRGCLLFAISLAFPSRQPRGRKGLQMYDVIIHIKRMSAYKKNCDPPTGWSALRGVAHVERRRTVPPQPLGTTVQHPQSFQSRHRSEGIAAHRKI